jgi:hypothetical protein
LDPGFEIRDGQKSGPRIQDKHPGSATVMKNSKFSFQYMLSELKQLVRTTTEKFPFSSKNYAAVFRKKLLTTCR